MKLRKILAAATLAATVAAPVVADEATAPKMSMDDVIVSTQNYTAGEIIVPLILFYMLVMALSSSVESPLPET